MSVLKKFLKAWSSGEIGSDSIPDSANNDPPPVDVFEGIHGRFKLGSLRDRFRGVGRGAWKTNEPGKVVISDFRFGGFLAKNIPVRGIGRSGLFGRRFGFSDIRCGVGGLGFVEELVETVA